ncbi:MAG: lanthionine synthetase C family protein [Myxococcaceae bacterium]|nr:lanthionine synthetase C family protein [Myxococcaceae bacterium]
MATAKAMAPSVASRSWQPLVTERAERDRVIAELGRLADALARVEVDDAPLRAEVALALHYAEEVLPERGYRDAAMAQLSQAIDASSTAPSLALYGGVAGLAWVVEHLTEPEASQSEEDLNEEVDAFFLQALGAPPWRGHFDLISGLCGLGVYALERGARPTGVELRRRVLERLAELAEPSADGLAFAKPHGLRRPDRDLDFRRDLGMAHGLSGVIAFLSLVGESSGTVERLLIEALRFLTTRGKSPDGGFGYAHDAHQNARVAWCYGDLGIACALWLAALRLGEPRIRDEAVAAALRAAARPYADTGIVDASLCHGTAGAAHLFNVLWQSLGARPLREAAHRSVTSLLERARPSERLGDDRTFDARTNRWEPTHSFLMGSAGIALTLTAAISERPPDWDRLLLLSGRATP